MKQTLAVTLANLQSLPARLGPALVVVVGIAAVVGVLVGTQSVLRGFDRMLQGTGRDDRAILVGAGATAELTSAIPLHVAALARDLPGIRRNEAGRPLVSAELFAVTELRRASGGAMIDTMLAVRGIEAAGIALRPELRLLEGRWFTPGLRELVVGTSIAQTMPELQLGARLRFRGADWTIVGRFASGGDAHESELWTDMLVARDTFGGFGVSSMLAALEGPGALATLKAAAAADPRLQLDAWTERAFLTAQSQEFNTNVRAVSALIAGFMAVGALFGALNSLYTAVAARQREIATLRAIGFSSLPVVCSVLAEALLLALAGGLIGALIVSLLFDGMKISTSSKLTQLAFDLSVTPGLVLQGLAAALLIGLAGGLLPALRAARLPVAQALGALR